MKQNNEGNQNITEWLQPKFTKKEKKEKKERQKKLTRIIRRRRNEY